MAISVVMPALEMAQETGKLLAWRKKEGESVRKGEPLLEIETDKAVVEVEAPGDGTLGNYRRCGRGDSRGRNDCVAGGTGRETAGESRAGCAGSARHKRSGAASCSWGADRGCRQDSCCWSGAADFAEGEAAGEGIGR